jgi:8-oxo-dGTP pyrophosphatase MutT (NUDIX family)
MQVTCTDFLGKKHQVDEKDLINHTSVYGVCVVDGKILLIQDPRNMRWELPGGGLEKGETDRQGLEREFKEETSATPGPSTFLTEWQEYFYDLDHQRALRSQRKFYLVEGVDHPDDLRQTSNGDDSHKAEFLPMNELSDYSISDAAKRVFLFIETDYLLRSPANARRLRRSMDQARAGKTEKHELIDE